MASKSDDSGFQGGDDGARKALNAMETDIQNLWHDVEALQRAAITPSPFTFACIENGYISYFVIDARRVTIPEEA